MCIFPDIVCVVMGLIGVTALQWARVEMADRAVPHLNTWRCDLADREIPVICMQCYNVPAVRIVFR